MAEISYTKTNWVNNVTKLNADNMNHIENGIETLAVALNTKASVDYVDKTHYGYSGADLLIIPDGVTSVPSNAYKNTTYKCIVIPNSVVSIGIGAFYQCFNLEKIIMPDSIKTIGKSAFMYCTSLKGIEFLKNITNISETIFAYCTSFKSIIIPNGVTIVGKASFANCSNLTDITVPNSVTNINYRAFFNCQKLSIIDLTSFEKDSPFPALDNEAFYSCPITKIKVVKGRKAELASMTNWSAYASYIVEVPTVETVDAALATKLDTSNVVQTTGQSETAVMSQKATTDEINTLKSDLADLDNAVFYQQFEDITMDYYASHQDKSISIGDVIYTEFLQDTTGSIINVYSVKRRDKFRVTSVLSGSNYPVAIYLNSDMRMITASAVYPAETSYSVQVNELEVDNDYPFVLIPSRYSDSERYAVEKAVYKSKISTRTSELENDADFATRSEVPVLYTNNATENLYDATKSEVGFMNAKDSVDTTNTSYRVSDYIFLAKGSYVIQYDCITDRTGRISYTTYNSDKTPLVFFNQAGLNHTVVEMGEEGYIRFSTYKLQMQERVMLFAGSESKTQYVPFGEWTSLNDALVVDNVLWGKKWAVCGDSFTDGGTETILNEGRYFGKQYTYPYIIGNRQNMEIECFFRGGRTMGYPSDGTFQNSLTCPTSDAYYQNIPEDVDYITIYLGINDSHHARGSSSTDGEDITGVIPIGGVDDTDVSTYCGAYNTVLAWLVENRPFAHIGILVSNGCDTPEYRSVQIAIAKKYGIPYIDLNGDDKTPVMIRSQNQEIAQTVRDIVTRKQAADFDGSKTGTVNLHPNDDAQLYESYFIEDFLRRI